MLTNKQNQYSEEGQAIHEKLDGKVALRYLKEIEEHMDNQRTTLNK